MSNGIKTVFTFVLGAAVGAAVTWKFVEKKYSKLAQEEIDSVKEAFTKKYSEPTECSEPERTTIPSDEVQDSIEYSSIVATHYGVDKNSIEKGGSDTLKVGTPPYVISPDEFDEIEDYESISLIYFSDGVLTDDKYELVEDVENTVGKASLTRFGEYEEDSVFVRNDRLKCDYEILKDERYYEDLNPEEDE